MKYIVRVTPEESEKIQKIVFEKYNGSWPGAGQNVKFTDRKYLTIHDNFQLFAANDISPMEGEYTPLNVATWMSIFGKLMSTQKKGKTKEQELQEKIKELQDELEKTKKTRKFNLGEWVFLEDEQRALKISNQGGDGYKCAQGGRVYRGAKRLATTQEIVETLSKAAELKGYIEGVYVNKSNISSYTGREEILRPSRKSDCLVGNWFEKGGVVIYNDTLDEWATIVKPAVKLASYIVTKVDRATLEIGCRNVLLTDFIGLRNIMVKNNLTNVKFDNYDVFTIKEMNQVIDKLKTK